MHLFYTPDLLDNFYIFSEEESKHCSRVLRLNNGDEVQLTDGKGNMYVAKITDCHLKRTSIEILSKIENFEKRNYFLHIAIAPTKNIERLEWFLEKATEIGIDEITPLLTSRSERKVVNEERLNKIITSAVKQSIKAYHPKLNAITPFTKFLEKTSEEQKFIAHCDTYQRTSLKKIYTPSKTVLILIGPEGDFSPQEIELSAKHGFEGISMGNSRLRTETAGVVACHTINLLSEG